MIRTGRKYMPDEVLPLVTPGAKRGFDGDTVRLSSTRLRCFQRSQVCVGCGIVGTYFVKEKSSGVTYHLNFYASRSDGSEVLMTRDHIVPRCRGGTSSLDNLQTMCAPCNNTKGAGQGPVVSGTGLGPRDESRLFALARLNIDQRPLPRFVYDSPFAVAVAAALHGEPAPDNAVAAAREYVAYIQRRKQARKAWAAAKRAARTTSAAATVCE